MKTNTLVLTALLTLTAGAALGACDTEDAPDTALRSVTVTDSWDIHGPTQLPDVNSCDDYWNDRCANLTPAQCQIAQNRYKCANTDQGVVVEDGYWIDATATTWRAVDKEGAVGTDGAEDPFNACEGLEDHEACAQLAALAEQLVAALPELMQSSPNGGVGRLVTGKQGAAISSEFPLEGSDDLLLGLADVLGWSVPALTEAPLAGDYVFEDDVILAIRPNGTLSLSTAAIAIVQDQALESAGDCGGVGGLDGLADSADHMIDQVKLEGP